MIPFRPLFRNPHWQTVAAHYWQRPEADGSLARRLFRTEPDVQVAVDSVQPKGPVAGHVVMVHGLEGSAEAGYIRSLSAAAVRAGFAAHRFHMRTCGGTEHLCNTLYHAGLTSDLEFVVRQIQAESPARLFLVGFSLGGNVVMKLAGELAAGGPALIRGVCGVSTPLDLAACARRIAEPDNWIYQRRFVRRMRARLFATGRYQRSDLAGLRSVWEIDDRITAPSFGFGGAENYYRRQSALGFVKDIRVPALLIQAQDDTFVPFEIFSAQEVRANPLIELRATETGGHLGFLGRLPHRLWLDETILEWMQEHR